MKKFILLAVTALFVTTASAQIVSSSSRSITTEKRESTSISYFRAGMNFTTVTNNDEFENKGRKLGYSIAYGFNKAIATNGAYWGMEFGLGSRGFTDTYDGGELSDELTMLSYNAVVSPFNFGWKYEVIDGLKVDAHIGAYVSYDFAGKLKYETSYDYSEEYTIDEIEDYSSIDAGVIFGFGVWYKDRFNVDLSFQNGMINMFDSGGSCKFNTRNILLRVGITF